MYQDYISENQSDEASVSVEFCMIGALDNESVTASYDEADFIEKHLDDVMKSEYTNSLEYNEYSIETPDEMLESRQEDIQLEKAKEYIKNGDIFQVVLSNPMRAKASGSLFDTYRALRATNPSPYMFYFSSSDMEVAGAKIMSMVFRWKLTLFLSE